MRDTVVLVGPAQAVLYDTKVIALHLMVATPREGRLVLNIGACGDLDLRSEVAQGRFRAALISALTRHFRRVRACGSDDELIAAIPEHEPAGEPVLN